MRTRLQLLARSLLLGVLAVAPLITALPAAEPGAPMTEKAAFIYRLTVTDRLRVSIFQEDDLADIVRVDARGNIKLKLVGDIHVAGLTVNDAQFTVEAAYRDGRFLRNPQVTISIEEYAPREVSIQGQVKAPGRFLLPIESTFSVVELVTKAGGLTDIAKGTAVVVTRITPEGKKLTFVVDVDSAIRGRKGSPDDNSALLLEPGDIVYVPERII
jgi:polysaccharide biosynthesis/export protein